MTSSLFEKGGPHDVRRIGPDRYRMSVSLPVDGDGMVGRQCVTEVCSPAHFKVTPGTGFKDQEVAYCPYCRAAADPHDFHTSDQARYVKDVALQEASDGPDRIIRESLKLGPSGRRKLAGGLISMELQYKPARRAPPRRPKEEELRRDVRCPHCGLEHAVFGLATWCADCANDIFLEHVRAELATIRLILDDVPGRDERLGRRVAARDIENALEDLVSIFEAVLKLITRRHLEGSGQSPEQIDDVFRKKVKHTYQSIEAARQTWKDLVGGDLLAPIAPDDQHSLAAVFEKRHPITHNLGVVDRKYLERTRSGELKGREIRVTVQEVGEAAETVLAVLEGAYRDLR